MTPQDKEEIKNMIKQEIQLALTNVSQKKSGDTPKEFYDLVPKGYAQLHGPRATKRPAPSLANIGQFFYDTTGTGLPMWVDSAGANWRDGSGNIVS